MENISGQVKWWWCLSWLLFFNSHLRVAARVTSTLLNGSIVFFPIHFVVREHRLYGTDWLGMGTSMFLTRVVAKKSVWALSSISPRLALKKGTRKSALTFIRWIRNLIFLLFSQGHEAVNDSSGKQHRRAQKGGEACTEKHGRQRDPGGINRTGLNWQVLSVNSSKSLFLTQCRKLPCARQASSQQKPCRCWQSPGTCSSMVIPSTQLQNQPICKKQLRVH